MADFKRGWQQLVVDTSAGELEYVVFPGPVPFIGATRLAGTPIAPSDAHLRLAELGHEHAALAFMGEQWAAGVGARRAM